MADILHDFTIEASPDKVFEAISTPTGLDRWWTKKSSGNAAPGSAWHLRFGPGFDWNATVSKSVPDKEFELAMGESDNDWNGTIVGFQLSPTPTGTQVSFYHTGWRAQNQHYKISSYCWAMLLRIMKLNLENGLTVQYEDRLKV